MEQLFHTVTTLSLMFYCAYHYEACHHHHNLWPMECLKGWCCFTLYLTTMWNHWMGLPGYLGFGVTNKLSLALTGTLSRCLEDVMKLVRANKLKLDLDEMEALLVGYNLIWRHSNIVILNEFAFPLKAHVHSWGGGVLLDSVLLLDGQMARSAYSQLRLICQLHPFLAKAGLAMFILGQSHAQLLQKSSTWGCPWKQYRKIQLLKNVAAHMLLGLHPDQSLFLSTAPHFTLWSNANRQLQQDQHRYLCGNEAHQWRVSQEGWVGREEIGGWMDDLRRTTVCLGPEEEDAVWEGSYGGKLQLQFLRLPHWSPSSGSVSSNRLEEGYRVEGEAAIHQTWFAGAFGAAWVGYQYC